MILSCRMPAPARFNKPVAAVHSERFLARSATMFLGNTEDSPRYADIKVI